ncbi:maleylpyruvate isomerase family mycothiol-dependent enzyme [Saccharopolyspora rosea]|uniref:Maleylpyruvate isomerase family mycothiol-dependent enzyme n=1 Tax=Saccharopolyspora rosea TaxID=524884 RepID=A0ABW3FYT0_9PSEU|nr:maleylpyruvate isomerase family mycothiol-dependent enzyme [Saccharopolyspora rosea]
MRNADPALAVPTCPAWNLGQLLRHLNGAHRWAETVVRTRAAEEVPDDPVNDVPLLGGEDLAELGARLTDGAAALAGALRDAGPDTRVWSPAPGHMTTLFWARRMAHETLVHRADVALAVGVEFTVDGQLAVDGLEEWLTFSCFGEAYEPRPGVPDLLGPGRTVHLHATDAEAEWTVDLTGNAPALHREHAKAAAAVRAPLADLLLFAYGRRTADDVETFGDRDLLHLWRRRASFWLE